MIIELVAAVVVFMAGFGIAEQCATTKANRERMRSEGVKVYDDRD